MNIAAVIVTRGDVSLKEISVSLPEEWELLVWSNGTRFQRLPAHDRVVRESFEIPDLGVYGRYAAIDHTDGELIYVQDDDCVVSDPQAIVDAWLEASGATAGLPAIWNHVVCNMPANFRARHFYDEHSLVGFGGCFHRDAPMRAFTRFNENELSGHPFNYPWNHPVMDRFTRTCDMVFTGLTPRVLVDIEYEDMPWASADNRMWRQPWHQAVRDEMLELVLKVRDA